MDWLDQHGYHYELIDVRVHPEKMEELMEISGQTYAPTLVVNDLVLPNFDVKQLEKFLKENHIKSRSD